MAASWNGWMEYGFDSRDMASHPENAVPKLTGLIGWGQTDKTKTTDWS
jgi:hypothetical protein